MTIVVQPEEIPFYPRLGFEKIALDQGPQYYVVPYHGNCIGWEILFLPLTGQSN